MSHRRQRIQLIAFAAATVLAVTYGSVQYLGAGSIIKPPYRIEAQFARDGGIYPRADVELLGTRIGTVDDVVAGAHGTTRVLIDIDHGVDVPASVTARIAAKSAIGEQVVELTPRGDGGPDLRPGSVIPVSRTATPLATDQLLGDLDGLARSLPADDLRTALAEASTALRGTGPSISRGITDSATVTSQTVAHLDQLTSLIRNARTTLDTQVALSPQIRSGLADTGALLSRIARLNDTLTDLTIDGAGAAAQTTSLVHDLSPLLPPLLENTITLADVAGNRLPELHKLLVLFPWTIQTAAYGIRYCDRYDPATGQPVAATCHYDAEGRPIYHAYFAVQLPELPGNPPYLACTKGYEATRRYLPDGMPLAGGPREPANPKPNLTVGCTSKPSDPTQPNVRGAQNVR